MDEDSGVKAPVTRLRRRLSTEAEGTQSPLTPSTPTKKRGTRLAKPALELIEENGKVSPTVTEDVPKKATRKASTKDIDVPEGTPLTPARRSTRIRSNTSLVMEVAHNSVADSPRAKRALRRASQIGSDTESSTPARQTRRTRKDSTSSVEKLAITHSNEKAIAQVADAISEEPEKEIKDSQHDTSNNSTPTRKSPRLNKKDNKTADGPKKGLNESVKQNDQDNNITKVAEEEESSTNQIPLLTKEAKISNNNTINKSDAQDTANISHESAKLINEINTNPKKPQHANKTISATEELTNVKGNRKRTKSWTTITSGDTPAGSINLNKFTSGDGVVKKIDIQSPNKSVTIYNTSIRNKENIQMTKPAAMDAGDIIKILEKTPGKDIQSFVFMEDSDSNSGSVKLSTDIHDGDDRKTEVDDQCVPVVKSASPKRLTSESFTVEPMDIDETIPENVTINDFSDKSNASDDKVTDAEQNTSLPNERSVDNKNSNKFLTSQQQQLNGSKRKSSISASEENTNKSNKSLLAGKSQRKSSISMQYESGDNLGENNKSKRNSSLSKSESDNKLKSSINTQFEENINDSSNKSKRKSVSETETQNVFNENKSTFVLSQLKDVSENETNVIKSPNDSNNDFSKSAKNIVKETEQNKSSHNYLTSTPLQQKSLQKLAMQINTSVISPNTEIKNTSKNNKTKTPVKNTSNIEHDSDSSSSDDSNEKSKLIDNEAKDASDDYESGDSRDDEEKQYEDDNAIPEQGETLESEQNFSNDSDYEKDSFVVSSSEEDEDLLSGSGDDLSFSDNELKMTAKSKKKFDERKRKEQKNASREMYEARHKVNESKNSKSKSKKSKTKKLDSSESEEENQPIKKNRLRLDSSQDLTLENEDADESVTYKKKKTKRLSESVCEDNASEIEITINNQSATIKNDPLVTAVKQEPKTPQKDFNVSIALINDNIEQVQVNSNDLDFKVNETSDPLQATVAHVDEESDSDISENMEIKENYDSVLENLNRANDRQKKLKTHDTSLNLNIYTKAKVKEPIVDQLNLTQTKKPKKNKTEVPKINEQIETITNNEVSVIMEKKDDGENSDSIDMRLLFSEDSNDSEVNSSKFKADSKQNFADKLIPLKKAEAKTNIRKSLDDPEDTNISFFIDTKGDFEEIDTSTQNSAKKKKKHKHSLSEANDAPNNMPDSEQTTMGVNLSYNNGKKEKKNKSFDISQNNENIALDEKPINISLNSDNKKKKKHKSLLDVSQVTENIESEETPTVNVSLDNDKKKKKNKSHLDVSQVTEDENKVLEETPTNISLNSDKKKKKKNKSAFDVSQITEDAASNEVPANVSIGSEMKKKKNKSALDVSQIIEDAVEETSANVSHKSDKKKKKRNKSTCEVSETTEDAAVEESSVNVSLNSEKKKKKSKSTCEVFETTDAAVEESSLNVSLNSNKKKKKNTSTCEVFETTAEAAVEEPSLNVSLNSNKKKKKNTSTCEVSETTEEAAVEEPSLNVSLHSNKKKKKNTSTCEVSETTEEAVEESPGNVSLNSDKNKKNKSPSNEPQKKQITAADEPLTSQKKDKKNKKKKESLDTWNIKNNTGEDSDDAPMEVAYKSEKKSDNPEPEEDEIGLTKSKNKFKKKKKKKIQPQVDMITKEGVEVKAKKRKLDVGSSVIEDEFHISKSQKKKKFSENGEEGNEFAEGGKRHAKKRKAEDDSVQKNSKAFKGNFFEKIHVPRLPDSIVSQLEDQPKLSKKQKKVQAISTMPFIVEDGPRRKNKPSNYLEQSIYLNDSVSPVKQKLKSIKKVPKVLPFTPTAITSDEGYTSNFRINVLPQHIEFMAEASDITNFKEQYLSKQRLKKMKVERFKRQNNYKNKF